MSINLAEKFEDNEQYDKAYEEYKKAHAKKPKSIEILEKLGHLATILERTSDATEYYNKILVQDATNVLAYEQLMDIHAHTDRYKYYISRGNMHVVQQELSHAINDFKKALNKTQNSGELNSTRFVLATLYEQIDKPHKAIDLYLRILDTEIESTEDFIQGYELVFLKLAQIYTNENSLDSAIETLQRAIKMGVDTNNVNETLARLYLKNNQPDKARELTQDDLTKIKSLLEEGENIAAFDILDKHKDKYRKNAQYYLLLAQYYFNMKDWDKSLESINKFNELQKNSPLTYQMRALVFEEKNMYFDAHLNWAKYNLVRNDKDVALNDYLLAYQLKENDVDLTRDIAELLEDTGDKIHAAEFWEKLCNIEPTNKIALQKLAEFKEDIGDYKACIEALEGLYSLNNKNVTVIKKIATIYEKVKNKKKALEFYNKFILLSPIDDDYKLVKAKINKLESIEFEADEGFLEKIIRVFNRNK